MKIRYLLLISSLFLTGCDELYPALWKSDTKTPTGKTQIFLLMGQSNMTGDSTNYPDPPSPTNPHLAMYKNGRWMQAQNPVNQQSYAGYGPSMAFGLEVLKINPSNPVGLINCAVGATRIREWQPGKPYLEDCIAQVEATKSSGTLAGILFMQGEGDAQDFNTDWPQKFLTMVSYLRSKYPGIRIVYGQVGLMFKGDPKYQAFRDQQASVANGSTLKMITTVDLPMADNFHFVVPGAYDTLGKRFADAFYLP